MKSVSKTQNEYLTIPKAAKALGIPASTLRRAVNAEIVPSYQIFSKRRRVVLSEVRAAIAAFDGGQGDE